SGTPASTARTANWYLPGFNLYFAGEVQGLNLAGLLFFCSEHSPEVAVGPGLDPERRARQRELGDGAVGGDPGDAAGRLRRHPHVAVGTLDDVVVAADAARDRE